jgi:hypothetical protein
LIHRGFEFGDSAAKGEMDVEQDSDNKSKKQEKNGDLPTNIFFFARCPKWQ